VRSLLHGCRRQFYNATPGPCRGSGRRVTIRMLRPSPQLHSAIPTRFVGGSTGGTVGPSFFAADISPSVTPTARIVRMSSGLPIQRSPFGEHLRLRLCVFIVDMRFDSASYNDGITQDLISLLS
jgi:hypothetical protein